mmetsp:Transcript_2197/g.8592  ORF Transcript_2197/g.8592 Transcript_2197/m.8592 type:complete len:327 (+) Transcript_2197:929-1909(+)
MAAQRRLDVLDGTSFRLHDFDLLLCDLHVQSFPHLPLGSVLHRHTGPLRDASGQCRLNGRQQETLHSFLKLCLALCLTTFQLRLDFQQHLACTCCSISRMRQAHHLSFHRADPSVLALVELADLATATNHHLLQDCIGDGSVAILTHDLCHGLLVPAVHGHSHPCGGQKHHLQRVREAFKALALLEGESAAELRYHEFLVLVGHPLNIFLRNIDAVQRQQIQRRGHRLIPRPLRAQGSLHHASMPVIEELHGLELHGRICQLWLRRMRARGSAPGGGLACARGGHRQVGHRVGRRRTHANARRQVLDEFLLGWDGCGPRKTADGRS